MVWNITYNSIFINCIYVSYLDAYVPSKNEATRYGRWSNAIPNNNTYVNEDRKSQCRNYTRMAREVCKYFQRTYNKMLKQLWKWCLGSIRRTKKWCIIWSIHSYCRKFTSSSRKNTNKRSIWWARNRKGILPRKKKRIKWKINFKKGFNWKSNRICTNDMFICGIFNCSISSNRNDKYDNFV